MAHLDIIQKAYTAIVHHFIRTGRAPHYTELATLVGVHPDEARDLQRAAATSAMGSWLSPDTDYIGSWAPFSNVPTQYRVSVAGKSKGYAQ
jgi:hypothetical protein